MTKRIALITDSTCDIPAGWRAQYAIQTVPLTIIFGQQTYLDGVEMTAEQFYERLQRDSVHPTTSQPTPQAFLAAYKQAAQSGADEILAITLSSGLSGTVHSASQAAGESPIPVHVMDSRNTSMALGWQVVAAARVQQAGGGLDEMVAAVEAVRQAMVFYVSLDTIEYLARGGRIQDAARFLNSVLHIKPLVYVNPESGTVGASIPSRSRKAALETQYREFFRRTLSTQNLHIAVTHSDALPEAQALAENVKSGYPQAEVLVGIGSPILGVHVGPRAIGLCGYAG